MADTGFWVEPERSDRLTTVDRQTVPDFMRFSQMLLNGDELGGVRLLKKETVDMITSRGLPDAVLEGRGNGIGWGLANVNVMLDPSTVQYPTSVGEYERGGSAGTGLWVNPLEELIIVLMWQSSPSNPDSLKQRVKTLVHESLR